MKRCPMCNIEKPASREFFYSNSHRKDGFSQYCKPCRKIYYNNNKDMWLKGASERQTQRYHNDILYKLKVLMCGQLNKNLKKNKGTLEYLGCDIPFFKNWIESQWETGMNWDNHSLLGWHIDHFIPCASAKNEEELSKLFHYTNLRPMWGHDNQSKGCRVNEKWGNKII